MVVVAVAGGTENIGRTLVQALVATGKHEVLILGRRVNVGVSIELGVPIIPVDFTDVDALAMTLQDHRVHTVISALAMPHPQNGDSCYETELIRASNISSTTERFILNLWTFPGTEKHVPKLSSVTAKLKVDEELRRVTNLEITKFYYGHFLDYWGMPKVKSHMTPMTMVLDIPNNMAAIPGDGEVPVVFTHTCDVARFVAKSLDLKKWEPDYYIIGDRVTWNEFLRMAEDAKGSKFSVVYDDIAKLDCGDVSELPGNALDYEHLPKERCKRLLATFGLRFADGSFNLEPRSLMNDLFPEIKTMTVREMLEAAWT